MLSEQNLAKLIADRRRDVGLDQPTLAQRVGVSQQTVSRWEKGTNTPNRQFLAGLAEVLNVDLDRLYRVAGYYESSMNNTESAAVFDAAIATMAEFSNDQLVDLLDAAWRTYRLRAGALAVAEESSG